MSGNYRVVEHYARRQIFEYYRAYRCPFYDITFELDIGPLKIFASQREYSLYATLCYTFTTAMAQVEDFLYRFVDGRIVLYDTLNVGMTVPAPHGCFSFANVPYDSDPGRFFAHSRKLVAKAGRALTLEETGWQNSIFFTALPSVPFTSFHHAPADDPTAGEPKVAFGQFREEGKRWILPICVQVNHAFIDGRALGELYTRAEELFARPEELFVRPETGLEGRVS